MKRPSGLLILQFHWPPISYYNKLRKSQTNMMHHIRSGWSATRAQSQVSLVPILIDVIQQTSHSLRESQCTGQFDETNA